MSVFATKDPVVVIVGPTCSGKTTLKRMMVKAGFKEIKTWTSRKKRPDESEKDYEFVSRNVMQVCYKEGMFVEMTEYDSELYASLKKDYISGAGLGPKVIVLDANGARRVLHRLSDVPFIFVYLNPHPDVLANRAVRRDMDKKEFKRRMDADAKELLDFYEDYFSSAISTCIEPVDDVQGTYYAKNPIENCKNLVGVVASSWHALDQDFAQWLWRFAMVMSFETK